MYSYEWAPATIGFDMKVRQTNRIKRGPFLKQKGAILKIPTRKYSLFIIALT